jgi:hypothetical protein
MVQWSNRQEYENTEQGKVMQIIPRNNGTVFPPHFLLQVNRRKVKYNTQWIGTQLIYT